MPKSFYTIFVLGILYEFDDVAEEIYYVFIFTFITILHASLNLRKSCVKIFHSHAIISLVFMDFGFNLEVVLY